MNKLPKEKRDQLILVGMGTLALLILIIYGLIRPQYAAISKINEEINAARDDLQIQERHHQNGRHRVQPVGGLD